jgi:hypothetical protein
MLLLVNKALPTLLRYSPRNVGRLIAPQNASRIAETPRAGFLWAADNDAFTGFNQTRYLQMLARVADMPGCLFVTCPDIVGNAGATLELFRDWGPTVAKVAPVALVAQDGLTNEATPWSEFSALFIGGTSEWKLGDQARALMAEATERGKWVHMGRVNSWRRVEYAKACGVDSIDGTQLSWWSDRWIDKFAEMATSPVQGILENGAPPGLSAGRGCFRYGLGDPTS